ncbi:AMP-binding protein [Sinobaca sp. H24]|uniref:AMP-binding protein n=1 Tax=Sinobaca sp. H24 TaxID=2923376 RepID=UPI00207A169B|nr:AMP-binding protein [Sinobaca sp. H24]
MEVQPWHRFYGEGVPAEVEIPTMEVFKLLERSYKDYPEYTAIIDGERIWSYKELYEDAVCLAASMREEGFKKGERTALMLSNSAEYIISYFAIQKLGGIVVQVNPMYQSSEIQYLIEDSQLSWFILHEQQSPKFSSLDVSDIHFVYVRPSGREAAESGHDFLVDDQQTFPAGRSA